MTRAHHVGEREQRPQHRVLVPRIGNPNQRGARERHTNRLTLTTIDPVVAERAARDALGRDARTTVRAHPVAERERGDNQVALAQVVHVGTRLLHHPDELVPDRADRVRRVAAVIPEVGPANASQDDADDSIRGFLEDRVGPVTHRDVHRAVEDRCSHRFPPYGARTRVSSRSDASEDTPTISNQAPEIIHTSRISIATAATYKPATRPAISAVAPAISTMYKPVPLASRGTRKPTLLSPVRIA